MGAFAKLYDTPNGQFLVTTETGDDGPCVKMRAASVGGVECSIMLGPWSDDDAGWDHVDRILAEFTQAEADQRAASMQAMVRGFLSNEGAR